MFCQSHLHFPMAREALKQTSLLRGAVSASVPVTRKVIPQEALCRMRDFPALGGWRKAQNQAQNGHS